MGLRQGWIGLLLGALLAACVMGCQDDSSSAKSESLQSSEPSEAEQLTAEFPAPLGCNLGAGSDFLKFNGKTYTQNSPCTTDVAAYYDASQNSIELSAQNNLFGLGSGSSLIFAFDWQATGTTGLFLAPPDFLFLQEDGHVYLCFFGLGAVNVTRRDDVGGIIAGDYAFQNLVIPFLCPVTSITGSFSARREADYVSGMGTQAHPVMLTPGGPAAAGDIAENGTSNYAFTATATSHTLALTATESDLAWGIYSHKPNLGDGAIAICDNAPTAADEVCLVSGLSVGKTYYVQVYEQGDHAGRYRVAVN